MVSPFDAAESAKLGYYVYLYSDPRNGRPFYIGKGKGNRVFSHLADDADHEKNSRIREIRGAGGLTPFRRSSRYEGRPVARGRGQGDWSDHDEQQEASTS